VLLEKALETKRDKVKHAWLVNEAGKLKKSVSFKGKAAAETEEKLFVIGKHRIYVFKSTPKVLFDYLLYFYFNTKKKKKQT
jgi:hypothetical protein